MQALLISIAGVAGVLSRYFATLAITSAAGTAFPYGTVAVNIVGSFLVGLVYVVGMERLAISETARVTLMVGFLGGFTTFSSFALETARLIEGGQWGLAAANIAGSVILCVVAAATGLALGRAFG